MAELHFDIVHPPSLYKLKFSLVSSLDFTGNISVALKMNIPLQNLSAQNVSVICIGLFSVISFHNLSATKCNNNKTYQATKRIRPQNVSDHKTYQVQKVSCGKSMSEIFFFCKLFLNWKGQGFTNGIRAAQRLENTRVERCR